MGPRRHHTKSRLGCSQCKVRRIKCDEVKPVCSNCQRREIECDFPQPPVSSTPQQSASASPGSPNGATGLSPQGTLQGTITPPDPTQHGLSGSLSIIDMELLHHFTTVTYLSLPMGAAATDEIWPVHVVQLGFKYDFLLHSILAVAAFHLSVLRPAYYDLYALKASQHQALALESVQSALAEVDDSSCHAIFAFSCLVVVQAFGAPWGSPNTDLESALRVILDGLSLVRGCNAVIQKHWTALYFGPLRSLLQAGKLNETTPAHETPGNHHITELLKICSQGSSAGAGAGVGIGASAEGQDGASDDNHAYTLAIHELLKCYSQLVVLQARGQDLRAPTFVWPSVVPQNFVVLLQKRTPESLVILAYYAVLLHGIDDQWYVKGRAHFLVSTIEKAVGEAWSEYLTWPKQMVGISV